MIFGDTTRAALLDEYARAARNVDVGRDRALTRTRLPLSTVDDIRLVSTVSRPSKGGWRSRHRSSTVEGRLVTEFGEPGHAVDVGDRPELRPLRPAHRPGAAG